MVSIIVFSIFIFDTLLFAYPTLAKFKNIPPESNKTINHLPANKNKIYTIKYSKYTTITAYNSIPNQTDNTPCITANNFNVCKHGIEDTVAVNFLKFGTKIRIPDIFGDKIFTVRDKMNARYTNRVDIWMINKDDAIKLGKRLAKIDILE
jgi:3D (Asp-Asp-Asp) domain-containing protein